MSNAVDVLLVGGVASGRQMCAMRPVVPELVWNDTNTMTAHIYEHTVFTSSDGKKYHIALDGEDESSEAEIELLIDATGFQPGWDINERDIPISGWRPNEVQADG